MAGTLKRGLLALVLTLALALGLAACGRSSTSAPRSLPASGAGGSSLQEVSPPGAVQQLKSALDRYQPELTIQAPANGALLPPGPWTLDLRLRDWPLVDAGSLGLGPHLVVQIDDREPIRITAAESPSADGSQTRRVRLTLDPLSPGSHRITSYAARPWGEAVKDPGASAQITVHRVAATPLTQPQAGEPQLIPVSPPSLSGSEPVLIDWLLRDAPLQHLRDGDTHWRLRVTVNGDSFQVDRQMPIWLKGFRPGSNAVLLELLDGLGEPIAPAINTLVQEVILRPGERPVWSSNRLAPEVMAALLGEGPPASRPPGPAAKSPPVLPSTPASTTPSGSQPTPDSTGGEPQAQAADVASPGETATTTDQTTEAADSFDPAPNNSVPNAPLNNTSSATERVVDDLASSAPAATPEAAPAAAAETMDPTHEDEPVPTPEVSNVATPAETPVRAPALPPARSELNADGSVIRPKREGFLSGLRNGAS
jgi:hypothetical protein